MHCLVDTESSEVLKSAVCCRKGRLLVDAKEIGKRVREARKHLGVTQADAAELAGISERTVREIEQGNARSSFAAYLSLANVVGLRIELTSEARNGGQRGLPRASLTLQ